MENRENKTLSVAVMSGKGGVGKSNLSLNLAYALSDINFSTLLLDCDLGLANLDVLLGITPEINIQDVLQNEVDVLAALVPLKTAQNNNFALLPSASGIPDLVEMPIAKRVELLTKIEPVFSDYPMIFLDLGAGINHTVQYFASISTVRIIVLTPEPTSLTDAYALIKVLSVNASLKEFLVIVNQAENTKEAKELFERLATACERFLNVTPVLLGIVCYDPKTTDAIRYQKPFLELYPNSPAALDIKEIALKLTKIYGGMQERIQKNPPLAKNRQS